MPRRISLRAELKHCAGSIISGAVNNFCFSVPILCIRFGRNGIRTDHFRIIFEGGEVVSHRNLLVYQNEIPVSPDILNGSSRHLLGSFLQIQYSSWLELCRLCESFFSVYPGYYIWTGKEIELLELGDALWTTGYIRPLAKEKTKRLYFRRLFGFFNLPVPDDPCHRLGELGLRGRPDIFLAWLRDRYLSYWEDRED